MSITTKETRKFTVESRNPNNIKIKQSRRKHDSGCRMFEVNGYLGSDVIHIRYKGKTICRLDINNDGTINIFGGYKTKVELDVLSLGYSDCFINCEDRSEQWVKS